MILSLIDWIFIILGIAAILGVFLVSYRYTGPRASEVEESAEKISEVSQSQGDGFENLEEYLNVKANFGTGNGSIKDILETFSRLPVAMGLPFGGFLFACIIALLSAVLTFWVTSILRPGFIFFLLIYALIFYGFYELSTWISNFRARRFEEQLEQAVGIIIGGLRSGLNIQESMGLVSEHTNGAISREFTEVRRKLSLGMPIGLSLSGVVERYYSEGVYLFVCAISAKWMGSNDSIRVFTSVRSLLQDRRKHVMRLQSQLSGSRLAAFFVALMPYGMLAYLYFAQPGWVARLLEEPTGRNLFAAAVAVQIIGLYWVQRQLKIQL